MTTMAGLKIKRFREERGLTRAAFGAWYGAPGSTVQGWEEDGKRASGPVVNQIAANAIAAHADWYVQIRMENDMSSWAPDSWTRADARQMPHYEDAAALDAATTQLSSFPPLVFAGEALSLIHI